MLKITVRCKSTKHLFEVTQEEIYNTTTGSVIPESTKKGRRIRRFTSGELGDSVMEHKETKVRTTLGSIPKGKKDEYKLLYKDSLARRFEAVE